MAGSSAFSASGTTSEAQAREGVGFGPARPGAPIGEHLFEDPEDLQRS